MLPPYDVAMDKTITKSSTINSLVDFIQQEGESASLISKLNSRVMNAKNADIAEEQNHEVVMSQSEIEVNVRQADSSEPGQSLSGSKLDTLQIVEESTNGRTNVLKSEKTSEKSSHVYTVCIETVSSNISTTRSTTTKPKNGENGQSKPRTLPLSFSNPAFQLSSKSLRQKDAGTDSMSSVTSTPSNGADSDMSNLDGDVSHSSSSSGASPPRRRRSNYVKGQTYDETTQQAKLAVQSNPIAHTLPKASTRSHTEVTGDFFKLPDSHLPESHSSSSIHSKTTLPMGSTFSSSVTLDNSQSTLKSPAEVRRENTAQRQDIFSLASPREQAPAVFDENSNSQSTQTSEATFHITSGTNNFPQFSLIMPNPKTALSQSYGFDTAATLPADSRQKSVKSTTKAHSEMVLPSLSHHKSQENSQTSHIQITPLYKPNPIEPLITPSPKAQSTPIVGGLSVLDPTFQGNKNRTANNSTGLQHSPPARRNIITQFSTKPKTNPDSLGTSLAQESPVIESTMLQIETRPSRVQSGQVIHRVPPMSSGAGLGQAPIWTRRSQDSPTDPRNNQDVS